MDTKLFEKIKKYFRLFSNPIIIINRSTQIVYCNTKNFCRVGATIQKYILQPLKLRDDNLEDAFFIHRGISYYTRISPFIDDMFICELFNTSCITRMAERTNIYADVASLFMSIGDNATHVWRKLGEIEKRLHNDKQADYLLSVVELEKPLISLEKLVKNLVQYLDICLKDSEYDVVEVRELIMDLQKQINERLQPINRCIEVVETTEIFRVFASKRHVITVLLNAIENAICYSPEDSVPSVTLYKGEDEATGQSMITIQIMNDAILHDDADNAEGYEFNFVRTGLGIPIIRRFADKVGGKLTINHMEEKYRICINLPEYTAKNSPIYRFNSTGNIQYTQEEREIVDFFMCKIISFYSQS